MVELARGDSFLPGHWRPWIQPTWAIVPGPVTMKPTVAFLCGGCGRVICAIDHRIDSAGNLSPSFVCVHLGCSWHVFIHLRGWPA